VKPADSDDLRSVLIALAIAAPAFVAWAALVRWVALKLLDRWSR
jgi:hypothetical protein